MKKQDLREKVQERIDYWLDELRGLPEEYSPEAYQMATDIRDVLAGLYDILRRFCRSPEEPAPEWVKEALY